MMKCWRFNLRRDLVRYVTDELTPGRVRRVEDHLLDCGECRDAAARLRSGQRLAAQLPQVTPQRDGWAAIEAAIDREDTRREPATRSAGWRARILTPRVVVAALIAVIFSSVIFITLHRRAVSEEEPGAPPSLAAADWREFQPVSIGDIESNTKPHVVAEGYVSEVRIDDKDGDLMFKLVDNLNAQDRFIVCEIIEPIRLQPPTVGSRVRVYGVSRYDAERNHNWYEVHPVLNIEVLH
ncbi:MAG TPA: zf-HC2 domain-containing protein [Blastocatellia bacterium]|nr:zf-HC2 domain-containing protein [Blastocatellia bacterium]